MATDHSSSDKQGKTRPPGLLRYLPWVFVLGIAIVWWSPNFAPNDAPAHACPSISKAEFAAAIAGGAVRGTARIKADGVVDMAFGAGIVSCASYSGSVIKPCKRPTDLVIEYTPASGEAFYVKVPAGKEYRFRIQRAPNTCEILDR